MEEDNLLMQRAAAGDKDAFEALVLRHRDHAVRFAARFTANRFDAEDIVQECFAKLYVRRKQWKDGASFKAYLYTIIRNRCTDLSRLKRETAALSEEELELVSREGLPETTALAKEERERVSLAVSRLKPEYRTALYLFAYEQMDYRSIAKVMGKTQAQIKIILHRARKTLKKQLLRREKE